MRINEKFVNIQGNKIRYLESGQAKEHLVLIHGLGSSAERWMPVISELNKKFHLVIPDLIGYGYSDKPLVDYTMDFFVDFLEKFLTKLGISKTSIIGSSLGGHIAAETVIRQPNLFEKMILVAPAGANPGLSPVMDEYLLAMIRPEREQTLKAFKMMAGPNREIDSHTIDDFIEKISLPNAKMAILSTLLGLKYADNLEKKLPKISIPSLIIWGCNDQVIPSTYANVFVSAIRNCTLFEMRDCGHTPFTEEPGVFSETVSDFLRG